MKFYSKEGNEIELNTFEPNTLVIARVTNPMAREEFKDFCQCNVWLADKFKKHGVTLVFCPDWVEFKDWK